RQRRASDWRKQVGQQQFIKPSRLVSQVEARRGPQRVEAVGEKQVGGVVGVVVARSPGRFAHTHLAQAGCLINVRQTRTAHRAVFVQQKTGSVNRPVISQFH